MVCRGRVRTVERDCTTPYIVPQCQETAVSGQSHLMCPAQMVFVRQVGCDPCLRHPCASRGPEAYWIPAYAGKTLKNAVPSCADRPAGFLCDPRLRLTRKQGSRGLQDSCVTPAPVSRESRGPDPVRLHNNARGIRPQAYWIPASAGKTLEDAVCRGLLHFLLANPLT